MKKTHFAMLKSLGELHKDERGVAFIWFSIVLVVLVGLTGLAIDGARLQNLHSNMQDVADAAALAGAKELDGASDAITRATNVAVNFLANNPTWSDIAAGGVQIVATGADAPKFYSAIGATDTLTTNPKTAAFIKVTTIDRGINNSFVRAVSTSTANYTRATAMAKATYSVCKPMQSFMCNPFEASETNPGNANNWTSNVAVGSMVKLTAGSGASGNWGFIDPPANGHNPHDLAPFWAEDTPENCSAVSAADAAAEVDPGNNGTFAAPGMNVRFDNPTGSGSESLSAPIVIDGLTATGSGTSCTNSVSATPAGAYTFQQTNVDATAYDNYCSAAGPIGSCPLPRDRTLTNYGGVGAWKSIYIGSGANTADLDAYWANHHSGTRPAELDTRYKIYMEETKGSGGSAQFTAASDLVEPHGPMCTSSTVGPPDRRLIRAAIVDCTYWSINGNSNSLPVVTLVAEFFMTEPANADGEIHAELVKTSQVNDPNGAVYQIVQLVR